MCTLTVLPTSTGALVAMNRDERRSRAQGSPLRTGVAGAVRWAFPQDAGAGGTWFTLASTGLVFALLNNYAAEPDDLPRPITRGRIPLLLADAPDAGAAIARVDALDLLEYRPFRVVIIDLAGPGGLSLGASDGHRLRWDRRAFGPAIFVSSGWNEPAVRAYREGLFTAFLDGNPAQASSPARALRALHFQPDDRDGHWGFSMSRPEAASRSYTEAELSGETLILRHWDAPPRDYGPAVEEGLERTAQTLRRTR